MKIAVAQLNIKRGDPWHNLHLIQQAAERAADQNADLLCLPEMVTTGFDWKINRLLLAETKQHHQEVSNIARRQQIAICGSFLECAASGMPCNTVLYFDAQGAELARYRKVHLFSLFNEDQHVEAGQELVVADVHFAKAGFAVCYDLRFPELFRKNTEMGAQIQLLPAAFPHPRLAHWRTLIQARAIENQCFFVAVNQAGFEQHDANVGSAHYFGHSMVLDPWGDILLELGEDEEQQCVEIDLSRVDEVRRKMTVLQDRRPELYG